VRHDYGQPNVQRKDRITQSQLWKLPYKYTHRPYPKLRLASRRTDYPPGLLDWITAERQGIEEIRLVQGRDDRNEPEAERDEERGGGGPRRGEQLRPLEHGRDDGRDDGALKIWLVTSTEGLGRAESELGQ
jgi:hypothetical protein